MNALDWLKPIACPKPPKNGVNSNWLSASIVLPSFATGKPLVSRLCHALTATRVEKPINIQHPGDAAQDEEHKEKPRPSAEPVIEQPPDTDPHH